MKVLSYNIREGGGDRLAAIAAVIRGEAPDAVALLEADDRGAAATLARDLGMDFAFGEANCAAHVAWLSRAPIRRATNHRHPGLAKTLLTIALDGADGAGGPFHLCATHLASRHEPPEPADEVPILLDLLAPLAGQPHLLVGDFNALAPGDPVGEPPAGVVPRGEAVAGTPRLAIGRLLDAGYRDCYRARHPAAPGHTYPTDHPWLRLDYLFASPALAPRLQGCDLVAGDGAVVASDHFPVWAVFFVTEESPA